MGQGPGYPGVGHVHRLAISFVSLVRLSSAMGVKSLDEIERIRQLEGSFDTTTGEVARLVADTEHNAIAFIGDELALMGFEDSRGFLFAPFRPHDEVRPTRVAREKI